MSVACTPSPRTGQHFISEMNRIPVEAAGTGTRRWRRRCRSFCAELAVRRTGKGRMWSSASGSVGKSATIETVPGTLKSPTIALVSVCAYGCGIQNNGLGWIRYRMIWQYACCRGITWVKINPLIRNFIICVKFILVLLVNQKGFSVKENWVGNVSLMLIFQFFTTQRPE